MSEAKEWFAAKWKKLVWIAGALLAVGGSGAYLADCDEAGDVMNQAAGIVKSVGEEPKKEDE